VSALVELHKEAGALARPRLTLERLTHGFLAWAEAHNWPDTSIESYRGRYHSRSAASTSAQRTT